MSETTKKPAYVIVLQGCGDTSAFVVDQAVWDWINSPRPDIAKGKSAWNEYELAPESVQTAWTKESAYNTPGHISITIGSMDNDRAKAASCAKLYGSDYGDSEDVHDVYQWVKNSDEYYLAESFEGCLY